MPAGAVVALRDVSMVASAGDYVAIAGPSGCGKSTLLHCSAAWTRRRAAKLRLEGRDVGRPRTPIGAHPPDGIGFVFQRFFLLPMLTRLGERRAAAGRSRRAAAERRNRTLELLDYVGLADRAATGPAQLSGGEMQRVAIARALANRPRLSWRTSRPASWIKRRESRSPRLFDCVTCDGTAVVVVTQDPAIAARGSGSSDAGRAYRRGALA